MNRLKDLLIQDISYIVATYGTFGIDEVLDASSLTVNGRGNLTSFIEEFYTDHCAIVTYNDLYTIVDSYVLPYSDLSTKELSAVLNVCSLYQKQVLDSE